MTRQSWRVPGYIVERLIGRGGSGEVWQARVAATGEPVALKRIPVEDADQLRSARSEAALLQTLDHPNLMRLHEVVTSGDSVVLVLDLAAGGTLAELVTARGRLTPGEVISTVAPVAGAVAYAHTHGIVHGDVTPANLLFTPEGLPLLADLGVARIIGDREPVRCTPAFVDPSVAAGCLPGPQSDVFALGGLALFALTGSATWPGDTALQALTAATTTHPDDMSHRLSACGVPEAMGVVLGRALRLDPRQRGTAAEFALELRHSGQPVAVELRAGRERETAVAASPLAGTTAGAAGLAAATDDARPALTHGARIRQLAVRPAPRRRRLLRYLPGRRRALAVGAGLALGAACVTVWLHGAAAGPAQRPHPAQPQVAAPSHVAAALALTQLDATRSSAFARRDPALLARVYLPGPLLVQDTALLTRIVPAGCGLRDARTTYTGVAVASRTDARIVVTTTARLSSSTLVCAGAARGRASGVGPTALRIVLALTADGYRIAAQRSG